MKIAFPALIGLLLSLFTTAEEAPNTQQTASFGAGCFWCVEAVFEKTDGVLDVVSGYQGGKTINPDYKEVCSGKTGHAEVVQVTFDPGKVNYTTLLDIFFSSHDPTTLNRQGADRGTQYRSAIFYHSEAQRTEAEAAKEKWDASGKFTRPIVTQIVEATPFYPAESYHQDYYRSNPYAPYSRYIRSKLKKLNLE